MTHTSPDDRQPTEPRHEDAETRRTPNDHGAEWTVVTEVDLISGSFPISRVRWRPEAGHSEE